ncbi:Xaa-Pro peptidase family protein [uncultured Bacteroides sp.]|uniref:M24 family metallopeptidase n=1 Tax=uncultured Bacteroides sp. TaxID=162156 RepID=UPI002AAC1DDC|nr:Xaa-Pro peptidase family protein [uncultured Bacteroides sp.]
MKSSNELALRQEKIRKLMIQSDIDAALITCNVNILYTCGQVLSGYCYLPVVGEPLYFVKRPSGLRGPQIHYIRKPEQIAELLKEKNIPFPETLMLEGDELSFTEYSRLTNIFPSARCVNGTPVIRDARSIKTDVEIELFRKAGAAHTRAYNQIPSIYQEGMDDRQFSIEIERIMRLEGCLGIFRVFGQSMEIFFGSVLTGSNAEAPSPYDFSLGGKGLSPALPGGLNGTKLEKGNTVMVDLGGNFNGYMCDMSRVYSIGKVCEEAYKAHQVCLEIQSEVIAMAKPGTVCETLYNKAIDIVTKAGFKDKFMGTKQQAKFVGHGIGLEINEAPVLAPRVKQELQPGMIFALEPKIVLPGVGPVGIENSWVISEHGIEKLTLCPEEIINLEMQ